MPSAGAIVPPVIIPLRKAVPGKPSTHIDTATFIELETETPKCKIYFTTDGSKPMPFKPVIGGKEYTFKYRGPFTLKSGKRTLKAVAVNRDGLHESNIVTKTFIVDDVGDPSSDIDLDEIETDNDYQDFDNRRSLNGSFKRSKKNRSIEQPREAWGSTNSNGWHHLLDDSDNDMNKSLAIPDNTLQSANFSGLQSANFPVQQQQNFWGMPVASPWTTAYPVNNMMMNTGVNYTVPFYDKPTQLGYVTESIIRNIEQPKLTVADVKRLMTEQQIRMLQNQPPVEQQDNKDPAILPESPGHGDWKGQLDHIYAHLLNRCRTDIYFRTLLGKPKMGMIAHVDIDEEEDSYVFSVTMTKPGVRIKPRVQRAPSPPPPAPIRAPPPSQGSAPPPVQSAPKQPAVRTTMKSAAAAAKIAATVKKDPPKPKEAPKPKPKQPKPKEKPVEDPYFETEEYEQEGTLKPWPTFSSEIDCEALRKAMKGMGTTEESIINVLGYRVSTQRQEITVMFKTMFGKNLREELDGELSGSFGKLCKALCYAPAEFDASEINRAIKGLGTDEDALIEILCTRTNAQIRHMKEVYKKLYKKEMEKDIKGDTSGDFGKVLLAQVSANREESPTFDRTAAKKDAEALFQAGEKKRGTDERMFIMIICQRSFPHLRGVFEEYEKLSRKTMDEVIKSEFSGDIKDALRTVVSVIQNKPLYFAKKMQKAMKGLGTDEDALIRVVVSRCESDMVQIKEAFENEYKKPLAEWIKDDISGDFGDLILALTGDRVPPSPTAEEVEATEGPPEIEEIEEEDYPEEGTVQDADPFDPKKDCEVLKKAMKGFGTDEEAIIEVWGRRSIAQRLEIINSYRSMYNKDLIKELKGETSGNFKDLLVGLGQSPDDYDANELRKAMKGLGTDEETLVEILCTRDNEQITALKESYTRLHKRDLEKDIISETSGHLKRILISMVQANRPASGNTIDRKKARNDAKALAEAGEEKFGTDESRFNVILCSRSFPQLRATFEEYAKVANKDIEDSIKEEMSGDLKKAMITIVRCVRDKAAQFAARLHNAMKGMGTDDSTLVRITVTRSEVDMVQIKEAFERLYDQPLGKFVADDISGDYRRLLLIVIGAEEFSKKK